MEIVIVELGLYDHVSTERDKRSTQQTLSTQTSTKNETRQQQIAAKQATFVLLGEGGGRTEARRFDHGGTGIRFHLQSSQLFFLLECVNDCGQQQQSRNINRLFDFIEIDFK